MLAYAPFLSLSLCLTHSFFSFSPRLKQQMYLLKAVCSGENPLWVDEGASTQMLMGCRPILTQLHSHQPRPFPVLAELTSHNPLLHRKRGIPSFSLLPLLRMLRVVLGPAAVLWDWLICNEKWVIYVIGFCLGEKKDMSCFGLFHGLFLKETPQRCQEVKWTRTSAFVLFLVSGPSKPLTNSTIVRVQVFEQ